MEAKHKAYLEELAAKVDAKLLEYVQVTPETRRQAQVVEAMRYSLEAGGKRIRPVLVLESAHPSPLSAYRGFFGSAPFGKVNAFLKNNGAAEIDWRLPANATHG